MTLEEHRQRHQLLHHALDELAADWAHHHWGELYSKHSIMELMEWSFQQTRNPTRPGCTRRGLEEGEG
jgi:hypothetical protein